MPWRGLSEATVTSSWTEIRFTPRTCIVPIRRPTSSRRAGMPNTLSVDRRPSAGCGCSWVCCSWGARFRCFVDGEEAPPRSARPRADVSPGIARRRGRSGEKRGGTRCAGPRSIGRTAGLDRRTRTLGSRDKRTWIEGQARGEEGCAHLHEGIRGDRSIDPRLDDRDTRTWLEGYAHFHGETRGDRWIQVRTWIEGQARGADASAGIDGSIPIALQWLPAEHRLLFEGGGLGVGWMRRALDLLLPTSRPRCHPRQI